jgi:hypothetical protein
VALLVLFGHLREDAEGRKSHIIGTGTHDQQSCFKDLVRFLMTTEGTGGETSARRHNIFKKQVLGTRTKEGEASVKHVPILECKPAKVGYKPAKP